MPAARPKFLVLLAVLFAVALANGQEILSGSAEMRLSLERLNVLGSVLMIGAHPDDEHTDTLAYFARGRLMRTAYLSLTRGEGGQNLIGPEQGDLLGIIRTQELLAARRIDGAEQYFTRAVDFGFSKTADETLAKWGRARVLSDIVWTIRRFRPDVIVLCFSGTPRDGHGQHQASGILGKEAFTAAADPRRFPEQLKWVEPWQAKRVVWNVFGGTEKPAVRIETGEYNPILGRSYAEIAALSRSMHRSQGMGMMAPRGARTTDFTHIAGEPESKDLFDGIDTSWGRVPRSGAAAAMIGQAIREFDAGHPDRIVHFLLDARRNLAGIKDPWVARKIEEIDATIALATGLWLDASADRWDIVGGSDTVVKATAIDRSPLAARLAGIRLQDGAAASLDSPLDSKLEYNAPVTNTVKRPAEPDRISQPYWLVLAKTGDCYTVENQLLIGLPENPPEWQEFFRIGFGSDVLDLPRAVSYRYADRSRGELVRPMVFVPRVAVETPPEAILFPNSRARKIEVVLEANKKGIAGRLRLDAPPHWQVQPASQDFKLAEAGQRLSLGFEVTPPPGSSRGRIRAVAAVDGRDISSGMRMISYPHFPPQAVFPRSEFDAVRADVRVLAKTIGYVMGAGDEMPGALRQLGCDVTLLSSADLTAGDLGRYDAIVTGVRAYNVRPDLRANQARLLEYVRNGGTLVVQYNVLDWRTDPDSLSGIGPYPIRVGHDRVSVEEAPVRLTDPADQVVREPNSITMADFDGWVQERGLYFASDWDPRYKTLFESHDPGEAPHPGGTLYTRYGKGVYVFTAYSWFRQLPAGVPGAYRIFADLLSAGKVLR